MAAPVDHVYTIAQTLLSAVEDIYTTAGILLPERRYVADGGEVALDCELVAVALSRVFRGAGGVPIDIISPQRCASVRTAEFHVWIVRCASVPQDTGDPPTVTTIESHALPLLTDSWLLVHGLQQAALNGDLGTTCDDVFIGQLVVQGPQGAYVGVDLVVEFGLGNIIAP